MKFYKLFLLFSICISPLFGEAKTVNILLIHSYHQGYSWTDSITAGITRNLSRSEFKVNLSIEYLDAKRIKPDSLYFAHIADVFNLKYKSTKIDCIISCDDDAFYFLLKYRNMLFRDIPVIAAGLAIKNEPQVEQADQLFGIYDDFKKEYSFFESWRIFDNTETIVFISDQTTTGKSSINFAKSLMKNHPNLRADFITDKTLDEIILDLNQRPDNTIVYPLMFNIDRNGNLYSHAEVVKILSKSIRFPIIASTQEQIGNGALGGYVHSWSRHAKITAQMVLDVLRGKRVNELSYSLDSLIIPMYDKIYLEKFGISESKLPAGSVIINMPISFFEKNKYFIYTVIGITMFFSLIILFIVINFNKRRIAEHNLHKLSHAVDQSPAIILITNTEGVIEYVNPKFSEVTGFTSEEVLGKKPNILKSGKTPDSVYKEMWDTITKGEGWKGELCNKRKNGENYWESISISPLFDHNGKITHYIGVKEDITDRKNNEKALKESKSNLEAALKELKLTQKQVLQQERLRSLGQLASGIAHDINNSLMPILGYSDLLIHQKTLDPAIEKKVRSIRTASLDIKRTIERMRDFYKPKLNDEDFSAVMINHIIVSAIELTKHRWKDLAESQAVSITIQTELQDDLSLVRGNESELREAIINLILNSCDAIDIEGLLTFKSYELNGEVIVQLTDTGRGMDEETVSRCIDPFYTTKGEKGTGLGLSMVYGIIQRHEGRIEINSKLNEGTTIKLFFKAIDPVEIPALDSNHEFDKRLKVLCIDDQEETRELLKNLFNDMKHEVKIVDSGTAGIKEFSSANKKGRGYDVVITDLGMPIMDGKTVALLVKTESKKTKVILLTGWGAFLNSDDHPEVDYILRKPVTINDINKSLKSLFS